MRILAWILVMAATAAPANASKAQLYLAQNPDKLFYACSRDFFQAAEFFKTRDEKQGLHLIPFPSAREYLHTVHQACEENRFTCWEKSRQVFLTWYFLSRMTWKANFALKNQFAAIALFSRGESEAAELLDRCRYIHKNLPPILRMPLTLDNTFEMEFKNGSRIMAFPDKPDAARQFAFTEAYVTEAAYKNDMFDFWTALYFTISEGIAKCHVDSTPNGKKDKGEWFHLQMRAQEEDSVFKRGTIHYSVVPGRDPNTPEGTEWKANAIKAMGLRRFSRECELSYEAVEGTPLFDENEFSKERNTGRLEAIRGLEIYRAWDWGYRNPACVWFQYLPHFHRVHVLAELCNLERIPLPKFAQKVVAKSYKLFRTNKFKDAGDPAGNAKNDQTDWTNIEVLKNDLQIKVQSVFSRPEQRTLAFRFLLTDRDDGKPGLLFDAEHCPILIEAFNGGLTIKENEDEVPEPSAYIHPYDALGYGVVNFVPVSAGGQEERPLRIASERGIRTSGIGGRRRA